jgi:hypothetical protein
LLKDSSNSFCKRTLNLIGEQAEFLLSRQVCFESVSLYDGQTQDFSPLPFAKLTISTRRNGTNWQISSGGDWTTIEPSKPFRLSLTTPIDKTIVKAPVTSTGLKQKFKGILPIAIFILGCRFLLLKRSNAKSTEAQKML